MGRKKILIKPIECPRLRSVTFYKRRKGLLKKAMELAVLCQSHVFLAFVDNETGKLITFNSHSHNELQDLFSKTPTHLREQFKTEDYTMLYGGGESTMKPKSKRRSAALRVKEEEDDYGYQLESVDISERPTRKPKREIKSRSKNIARNSKNRKNVMRIMGPHGSARYSYQEMKSSAQDSDEDQEDYYEDESQDRHHYYRSHHSERHHGEFLDPHNHQSSICDIINVFEDDGSQNRSSMEQVEEYHRKDNFKAHHRQMKGPSSRKLKAKLKLENLDIGELSREKKQYSEGEEEEGMPYKYTKQQSFHFKGKKQQSGQIERSEGDMDAKKTNIHSSKESQANSQFQQAQQQQQQMHNQMMYHLQMGGMAPPAYPPPAMGPIATPTMKDYSPYPMLMTPSPFPRFLMPGFGGPATGQSSQHFRMGLDIPTSGLFPTASPIYSYAGLMQTPVEMRPNFSATQPIFKPGPIQQKTSMQNLSNTALTSQKMRKGSEFSFIEGPKQRDDSGSIQPRDWYQSLLEMPPQVVNQRDMSNQQPNMSENQIVESPKHEQKKIISAEEVVRKGEEPH